MLCFLKPNDDFLKQVQERDRSLGSTFAYTGACLKMHKPPGRWYTGHQQTHLGSGLQTFKAAKSALREWSMFDTGWTRIFPSRAPITAQQIVSVIAQIGLCYSINGAEIQMVIDTDEHYGFSYATLPSHDLRGEERFSILYDPKTTHVSYEIYSFSQTRSLLSRCSILFTRALQHKFLRQSSDAMHTRTRTITGQ